MQFERGCCAGFCCFILFLFILWFLKPSKIHSINKQCSICNAYLPGVDIMDGGWSQEKKRPHRPPTSFLPSLCKTHLLVCCPPPQPFSPPSPLPRCIPPCGRSAAARATGGGTLVEGGLARDPAGTQGPPGLRRATTSLQTASSLHSDTPLHPLLRLQMLGMADATC